MARKTNWGQIHLLEARLAWWRGKYSYRKRVFDGYHGKYVFNQKYYPHHKDALAAAYAGMQKWGPIMGEAAAQVNKYIHAINVLRPPVNPVAQKEHWLLVNHPETHEGVRKVVAIILVRYPSLYITATTGGTHSSQSYHYLGRAYDIATSNWSAMDPMGSWISANLRKRLTEGIHKPTLSVKGGVNVSSSYWGSVTWANHANHIHVAV